VWYSDLKAELSRCQTKDNFVSKGLCKSRAVDRYCEGHWDAVKECVKPNRPSNNFN
jgi:hypothetical protein